MQETTTSAFGSAPARFLLRTPLPRAYMNFLGRKILRLLLTIQGLGAFALITLGVLVAKFRVARQVIRPLMYQEISRSGLRLLPMFLFLALALGFLVIGQSVAVLARGEYLVYGPALMRTCGRGAS